MQLRRTNAESRMNPRRAWWHPYTHPYVERRGSAAGCRRPPSSAACRRQSSAESHAGEDVAAPEPLQQSAAPPAPEATVEIRQTVARGRGMHLIEAAVAGSEVRCEPPVAAVQLPSNAVAACIRCGAFVGSLELQLSLHSPAGVQPAALPTLGGASRDGWSPVCCTRGCGQLYCSEACRSADAPVRAWDPAAALQRPQEGLQRPEEGWERGGVWIPIPCLGRA